MTRNLQYFRQSFNPQNISQTQTRILQANSIAFDYNFQINKMDKQYITSEEYQKIVENQAKILLHLEESENALDKTIRMSEKYYAETEQGFKEAIETIARIRSNFDAIYKNLRQIKNKGKVHEGEKGKSKSKSLKKGSSTKV